MEGEKLSALRINHIKQLIEEDINFYCARLLKFWAIFITTASVILTNTRDKNDYVKWNPCHLEAFNLGVF